jgi:uncharacterized membrane protein HdeD (DUF308 family)
MIARLASHWWLFLIRGILAVALGILMPLFPGAAIFTIAILFGAYAFVDGIVAIAAAIRMNHADLNWIWLVVEGVLGIIVGALTFFYPGITALFLVYLFGGWAVATGVLTIVSAIRLRKVISNETLLIVLGVLSVAAGIVIFWAPISGVFAIVWIVSVYALLTGVFFIWLALRLRRLPDVAAKIPA